MVWYFTCLYYVYGHHIQIHISTTVQKKNNEWKKYAHWQKWKMGQKIYTIKPQISLLDSDIPIQISMHVPIHSLVNRKSLSCQANSFKQSSDGHPHSFLLFIVITFFIIVDHSFPLSLFDVKLFSRRPYITVAAIMVLSLKIFKTSFIIFIDTSDKLYVQRIHF